VGEYGMDAVGLAPKVAAAGVRRVWAGVHDDLLVDLLRSSRKRRDESWRTRGDELEIPAELDTAGITDI